MFSRVNALGWGFADPFTPAQANQLDIDHANALDGAAGGLYSPSALLRVGGAFGLQIEPSSFFRMGSLSLFDYNSGDVTINSSGFQTGGGFPATFNGATTFAATVLHNAATTFAANATFNSGVSLIGAAGSTMTWGGTATFNDDVTFNDPVLVADNFQHTAGIAAFSSTANFGGATSITAGSFTIQGGVTTTFNSNVVLGATASILIRPLLGPDADTTINANTYDRVMVGTLSATRTYTLAAAPNGTEIQISMSQAGGSGTNQCRIYDENVIQLVVLQGDTSGQNNFAHIIRRAGSWEVFYFSKKP